MPSTSGSWSLLTQADGEWIETVGFREAIAGTEGLRVRIKAVGSNPIADTRWLGALLGQNATEINRIDHQDGRRRMTTSVWSIKGAPSGGTPSDLRARLVARARVRGLIPAQSAPAESAHGEAIFLSGRGEDLVATFNTKAVDSTVVFQWRQTE